MDDQCLSEAKTDRVLAIYSRLVGGAVLNKADLAQQFHVTQRSIQRDIESLRCFFAEQELPQDIVYDKRSRGYRLILPMPDPMSAERQQAILQQQIDEILFGIEQAKAQKAERYTIKQMERTRKSLEAKLAKLNDQSRKDDVVTFEQLGVDRLFVDESHYFKNRAKRCA